jgi:NADH:ubiquinone oxidoreductase subunit 5 (subunit L)/multisubunit Na+/H+ antiporter MnhA subunit
MVSVTLIIFIVISIILLFTAMVLSAMAASEARKGSDQCKQNCHKYAMWNAIVCGIAVAIIVVIMIIYIYTTRHTIAKKSSEYLHHYGERMGEYGGGRRDVSMSDLQPRDLV